MFCRNMKLKPPREHCCNLIIFHFSSSHSFAVQQFSKMPEKRLSRTTVQINGCLYHLGIINSHVDENESSGRVSAIGILFPSNVLCLMLPQF